MNEPLGLAALVVAVLAATFALASLFRRTEYVQNYNTRIDRRTEDEAQGLADDIEEEWRESLKDDIGDG